MEEGAEDTKTNRGVMTAATAEIEIGATTADPIARVRLAGNHNAHPTCSSDLGTNKAHLLTSIYG